MWDTSIPKIRLAMALDSLDQLPEHPLPDRYGWRFFRPGDEKHWARIEISAGEADNEATMMEKFHWEFTRPEELPKRMIFLTENGVPFATATAWDHEGGAGLLTFVAIDEEHQGQGLSRPLVALAMHRLKELGYRRAVLNTQTLSWLGIRIYHEFGFRPAPRTEQDAEGWNLVSEKSGIHFELNH